MDTFVCRHLVKSFGGVRALMDVSVDFPATGVVALVGPNGAGKTTLFNILTGFSRADSGQCALGDRDVGRMPPHRIAALGVARTFQEVRLVRRASVIDNLNLAANAMGGVLRQTLTFAAIKRTPANDEATSVLDMVGLTGRMHSQASDLSYGQQKLLSLACCVATRRRILLLDEPITGVDPSVSSLIVELIREIGRQGRLVIVIEHDLAAVTALADSAVVMEAGRIIGIGTPTDVFARPETLRAYRG